ncbi:glucose-1-phosphate adenylyltransferase, partial [Vibrio parahaemolyticus VP2007-007]
MVTIAERR